MLSFLPFLDQSKMFFKRHFHRITDLHPSLQLALSNLKLVNSTEIQQLSIPHILNGTNVVLTAQTGTGKTMAYLLPLLTRLLNDEQLAILLLVPSRHLQLQLTLVLRSLLSDMDNPPSFALVPRKKGIPNGSVSGNKLRILISSPKLLIDEYKKPKEMAIFMGSIGAVCFDETDQLFQGDGLEFLQKAKIALKRNKKWEETQFVFSGATLPPIKTPKSKTPRALIEKIVPGIVTIGGTNFHSTLDVVEERFIWCETDTIETKFEVLLALIIASKPINQILIFVSSPERSALVAEALRRTKLDNLHIDEIHGYQDRHTRSQTILEVAFKDPLEKIHLIVCTDVTARGVDFKHVQEIIHFDFVTDAADYIHRVGRTGRGSRPRGKSIAFVTEKDQKLANLIEDASRGIRGSRLDNHEEFFEKGEGEKIPLTGLLSRKRSFSK